MRKFRWNEPGDDGENIVMTTTDEEIIANFYPHWCEQMRKAGKDAWISYEECIEDFVAVHWAEEVPA